MGKLFSEETIDIQIEDDDFETLKNLCFRPYGYPNVKLEIENTDFSWMIRSALQILNTWVPMIKYYRQAVKPYVTDYVIEGYDHVNSIQDIYVSETYLIGLGCPVRNLMGPPMSLMASNDSSVIVDQMSLMSAYNTAKNVFQVEPKAEIIRPNIVRVDPAPYMEDNWVFVLTLNHENNLGCLDNWEKQWLIDYLTASVGVFIGNIRRKYSGVNLPVGSLGDTGANIYNESLAKQKELMEDLKKYKHLAQSYISIG